MYGWEQAFADRIEDIRKEEVSAIRRVALAIAYGVCLDAHPVSSLCSRFALCLMLFSVYPRRLTRGPRHPVHFSSGSLHHEHPGTCCVPPRSPCYSIVLCLVTT